MTDPLLIIFDVDGTLVDSRCAYLRALAATLAEAGITTPAEARALSVVGLSPPDMFAALLPAHAEAAGNLAARYKTHYAAGRVAHGEEGVLYPGVREGLSRLGENARLVLGVATGKSRRGLAHWLDRHGFAGLFVTRQTADDHPSKPHPAMLQAAIAETGIARGVMVGDTSFDIEMGRAAGFSTIGVSWGYHGAARLEGAGAECLVGTFAEVVAAIEAMALEPSRC